MKVCDVAVILLLAFSCSKVAEQKESDVAVEALKINQIQVLASHNSYKEAIEPPLMSLLLAEDSGFLSLDYQHVSLSQQLDLGLRKLEIDIVHDPEGGRFAKPLGLTLVKKSGGEPLPYDPDDKMQNPGFKVLHVQDIDFRSNCLCLEDCLNELKEWSEAHPTHLPIAISFNAKTGKIDRPGFTELLPFSKAAFDSLDASILSVISKEKIITPDDIRGTYETLEAGALNQNWPEIEKVRGKFMFVLDEQAEKYAPYLEGHPSLKGRVMFVNAAPGTPEAAFIILNDPITYQDSIQNLVKSGYIVRTRADANTMEARTGDYSRFNAALTSGAQFITTDYYLPDERFGTGYQIKMPDGKIAICNPITAPENCDDTQLEPSIKDLAKQ
ncbi:MAG: phosphatidylinositol-specific phospholipase C1-like protein [Bacteroidota bacterium]